MERDAIDLGSQDTKRLFRRYFIPTLLGMLSMSSVATIDGIFIGHGIGSNGVAAVNLVLPILMLFGGLGLMVGIGCSVVASIHLSHSKPKTARMNIAQALVFVSVLSTLLSVLLILFPTQIGRLLGSSDTLMPLVVDYAVWLAPSFVFQVWAGIGLFTIRLDGAPRIAMWCNVVSSLANIVLDWLFIFPLNLGLKGAAIASSLSVVIGGGIVAWYMFFRAKTLYWQAPKWSKNSLKLSIRNIGYQCRIGSSAMMGEFTLAMLMYMGNLVFMHYLGDDGVGAYGVVCYFMPFVFMVGNAISQSAQPIISFNYGRGNMLRVRSIQKTALTTAFLCGTLSTLLFVAIPKVLIALFLDLNTNAAHIAVTGLPYFSLGLIFFVTNLTVIGYYQSVERVKPATFFALLRGFVCLIPAFIFLPQLMGTTGIWLAMPTSEAITFILIVVYYLSTRRLNNRCK